MKGDIGLLKGDLDLGIILGHRASLYVPLRRSTSDAVPDPILTWGRARMRLDSSRMPWKLAQALPPVLLHAKPGEWEHFIRQAIVGGWL